jgi:hypothetical protein
MGQHQPPDLNEPNDPIEMIEAMIDGKRVFIPATSVMEFKDVVVAPDGTGSMPSDTGPSFAGTIVPKVRMAAGRPTTSTEELMSVFNQLALAELDRPHSPVVVLPSGAMELQRSGGTSTVSHLPKDRFAAPNPKELAEVRRLDPQGRHWRWVERANLRGWFVSLTNNFEDPFVFFVASEPVGLYEAQVVQPNFDSFSGHLRHMVSNGRVCLNERLGVPSLADMHGALAKWCLYIGAINRGIDPKFSR